jgi:hypothetical protein
MTEKIEALRLAEFLEMHWCKVDMPEAKAAAELRRLHQFAEDQIGRATAAEAALQMTKATHALKIAAVEAQRDALLAALKAGPGIEHTLPTGPCACSQCQFVRMRSAAIKAVEGESHAKSL